VSDEASPPSGSSARDVTLDLRAVLRGAGAALLLAVPAGFGQRAVSDGSSLKSLLFVIILVGFGWGGAVAAKAGVAGRGLTHGTVAGVVAVAGYLTIGVVARLVTATSAIVGAELGERRRRRPVPGDDGTDERSA
jgi:hypothetical protein